MRPLLPTLQKILLRLSLALAVAAAAFALFFHIYSRSGMPSKKEYRIDVRGGAKYFSGGRLEYRLGVPFLYAKGDAYAVGLQYGVLLKEEMALVFREFRRFEEEALERMARSMPWYKRLGLKLVAPVFLEFRIRSFQSRIPEEYIAQLRGMAEGSKIPMKELLKGIFYEDLACSQFVVQVPGGILHGRNADYNLPFLGEHPLVSRVSKTGKFSYVDVGIVGIPYVISGINEKGVTLSWSGANTRPLRGKGTMLHFNRIMEECRDLSDASRMGKNVDRFVVFVGSQTEGSAAAYDCVGGEERRTDMKGRSIYAANRCLSAAMGKKFNTLENRGWNNQGRLDKYREAFAEGKEWTVADAVALLSDNSFYHYHEVVPPLGGSEAIQHDQTMLSTVLDPQRQTVYFAIHPHFAGWSNWIRYQYQSDEVQGFRAADGRLRSPRVEKFLELKKKLSSADLKAPSAPAALIRELESSGLDNAWALDWLFWLCFQAKDPAKAERYVDRLIGKYPDLGLGYLRRAYLLKESGRDRQAIDCLRQALHAPLISEYERFFIYESMAWRQDTIGNGSEARRYAARAIDLIREYGAPPRMEMRIGELEKLASPPH